MKVPIPFAMRCFGSGADSVGHANFIAMVLAGIPPEEAMRKGHAYSGEQAKLLMKGLSLESTFDGGTTAEEIRTYLLNVASEINRHLAPKE